MVMIMTLMRVTGVTSYLFSDVLISSLLCLLILPLVAYMALQVYTRCLCRVPLPSLLVRHHSADVGNMHGKHAYCMHFPSRREILKSATKTMSFAPLFLGKVTGSGVQVGESKQAC